MDRHCDHCLVAYRRSDDTEREEPDYYLCPDCSDMAVWGVRCSWCNNIPTATRTCESNIEAGSKLRNLGADKYSPIGRALASSVRGKKNTQ